MARSTISYSQVGCENAFDEFMSRGEVRHKIGGCDTNMVQQAKEAACRPENIEALNGMADTGARLQIGVSRVGVDHTDGYNILARQAADVLASFCGPKDPPAGRIGRGIGFGNLSELVHHSTSLRIVELPMVAEPKIESSSTIPDKDDAFLSGLKVLGFGSATLATFATIIKVTRGISSVGAGGLFILPPGYDDDFSL